MQINQTNSTNQFIQQIGADIQNEISKKIKGKENEDTNVINKGLEKIDEETNNETDNKSAVSFLVDVITGLYSPVKDTLKCLSLQTNLYNQYTNELQNNSLSDNKKKDIENAANHAKQNILDITSSANISKLDNYITNYINPEVNKVENYLKSKFGINIDTSKINVNSMEQLGFKPNSNFNFDDILKEVKDVANNIHEKIVNLYEIDKKYGNIPKNEATMLDTSV